jgi:hypothetical protein
MTLLFIHMLLIFTTAIVKSVRKLLHEEFITLIVLLHRHTMKGPGPCDITSGVPAPLFSTIGKLVILLISEFSTVKLAENVARPNTASYSLDSSLTIRTIKIWEFRLPSMY